MAAPPQDPSPQPDATAGDRSGLRGRIDRLDRRLTAKVQADPRRILRRAAAAALATNILIVFTGGLVRVTASGLGCPTWPTCDGTRLVPLPGGEHEGWQTAIEFGNRLLTFLVLAAVLWLWYAVRATGPHHRSVVTASKLLPLGVLAQAVVGGITVLTGLAPYTVAVHFLLSMVLIGAAVVARERLLPVQGASPPVRGIQLTTTAVAIVAAGVLVLGTIVTGAGPHAGDPSAARLPIDIRLAAIAHADAVWMLLGLTVALLALTWASGPRRLQQAVRLLLIVELAQGGIGYLQYYLGVPRTLVSLHILGASVLWAVVMVVWTSARPLPTTSGPPLADDELAEPASDAEVAAAASGR
jgi:cytochrome c oxidase assembly protein subunit 15